MGNHTTPLLIALGLVAGCGGEINEPPTAGASSTSEAVAATNLFHAAELGDLGALQQHLGQAGGKSGVAERRSAQAVARLAGPVYPAAILAKRSRAFCPAVVSLHSLATRCSSASALSESSSFPE